MDKKVEETRQIFILEVTRTDLHVVMYILDHIPIQSNECFFYKIKNFSFIYLYNRHKKQTAP